MKMVSKFDQTITVSLFSLFILAILAFCGCSSSDNPSSPNSQNNLETGTMTDIDGNVYSTVKIGGQWWMSENLKVTRYRNGDPIDELPDSAGWFNASSGGYCMPDNDSDKTELYGLLYNGFAANDARNLAPNGWHIPSDSEFQVLVDYLGVNSGGKMKTTGTAHWNDPNLGATNESGFSSLPAGVRPPAAYFTNRGEIAFFWTTTLVIANPPHSMIRGNGYAETSVRQQMMPWLTGMSVRCIKD